MTDSFQGFPPQGIEFLAGLAKDNSKKYFDAHRKSYDGALIDPAKAFVSSLGRELSKTVGRSVHAEPRVNGSIFRMNRDLRFSADKTPYKTHLDFIFWEGQGKSRGCPAFYLRVAPGETILGAGMMGFRPSKLGAFREAVADGGSGASLEAAIAQATAQAGGADAVELRGSGYKKVPRGYKEDHPRAELLKHKGIHLQYRDHTPPAEQEGPEFVEWCCERYSRLDPLQRWLVETFDF